MDTYWIWWVAALALVIMEIFTGTFYMLSMALGFAVAGLCAYMGMPWGGQMVVATLLCSGSLAAIYSWKKNDPPPNPQANFSYDVGQTVQVVRWMDERHARVSYRGAEWDAELTPSSSVNTAKTTWRIKEVVGSHLNIE